MIPVFSDNFGLNTQSSKPVLAQISASSGGFNQMSSKLFASVVLQELIFLCARSFSNSSVSCLAFHVFHAMDVWCLLLPLPIWLKAKTRYKCGRVGDGWQFPPLTLGHMYECWGKGLLQNFAVLLISSSEVTGLHIWGLCSWEEQCSQLFTLNVWDVNLAMSTHTQNWWIQELTIA